MSWLLSPSGSIASIGFIGDVVITSVQVGDHLEWNGSNWVNAVPSGGAEVNDLSAAVTWANIPIANVPTGTSGSTVALGNHTHDSIADINLVDKTAAEVITGHWAIPSTINTQNGDYTLVLLDASKTIHKVSGGSGETITIPANASVAFPTGTLIAVENDGGGTLDIAITSDTLTSSADNTTGTRTLADGGSAVMEKMTSTTWKIAGNQMT